MKCLEFIVKKKEGSIDKKDKRKYSVFRLIWKEDIFKIILIQRYFKTDLNWFT